MITKNIKALIGYRLEQADESLEAADVLLQKELIRPSVNRSYYAMFYAVLALLAVEKKETSKHSGVISMFDKEFVKSGVIARGFSRWLHDAFDLRQQSDYAAELSISFQDASASLQHAKDFVKEIRDVLRKKYAFDNP